MLWFQARRIDVVVYVGESVEESMLGASMRIAIVLTGSRVAPHRAAAASLFGFPSLWLCKRSKIWI